MAIFVATNVLDIGNGLAGSGFEGLMNENYNLPNYISVGVRLILIGAIVASFVLLLVGSLQWITAGGDKDGTEKARKKITGAIIGLAIGLSAFAILRLIKVIFGFDILGDIVIPSITP